MSTINCHRCHKDCGLEARAQVFRTSECPHCMADLRCCLMCKYYDQSSYNNCREPQADRVSEKNKANFCAFFELHNNQNTANTVDNYINAAEALFKK